jgi:hypothetical protein
VNTPRTSADPGIIITDIKKIRFTIVVSGVTSSLWVLSFGVNEINSSSPAAQSMLLINKSAFP